MNPIFKKWAAGLALTLGCMVQLLPAQSPTSLPYAGLKTVQDFCDSVCKDNSMVSYVKLEHSQPDDQRPIRVFLAVSGSEEEIKVETDGRFRLPELPSSERGEARLVHYLGKGALTLTCGLGMHGEVPGSAAEAPILLSDLFAKLAKSAPRFLELGRNIAIQRGADPKTVESQLSITGITFAREKSSDGVVQLLKDGKVVDQIDLSATGPKTWSFAQFDPQKHQMRLVGRSSGPVPFRGEMKSGPVPATSNAIPIL
jgi:hypothetical protein